MRVSNGPWFDSGCSDFGEWHTLEAPHIATLPRYRFVRTLYTGKKSPIVSLDVTVDDELLFAGRNSVLAALKSQPDASTSASQGGVLVGYGNGDLG